MAWASRRGDEHRPPAEEDAGGRDPRVPRPFNIPVPDDKLEEVPYLTFPEGSKELEYMRQARMDLGGYLPARRRRPTR
jgi:hypothetical protein